jgi:hypothetical protein
LRTWAAQRFPVHPLTLGNFMVDETEKWGKVVKVR